MNIISKIIKNKQIKIHSIFINNQRFYSSSNNVILGGTDKSKLISDDGDDKELDSLYVHLKEEINYMKNHQNPFLLHHISLEPNKQLLENLSFAGYYSSYYPKRNTVQETPYHLFNTSLVSELYDFNPFLLILPHPRQKIDYPWNYNSQSIDLPLNINKNEFQNDSIQRIKDIYNLAKNQKSIELQQMSYQPATLNLLLLRDTYWSIQKNNQDKSSPCIKINELDIDNFDISAIDSNPLPFNVETDKYLKIESTYNITSKKNNNHNNIPIIIKVIWISQIDNNKPPSSSNDWKILDITFETPTINDLQK